MGRGPHINALSEISPFPAGSRSPVSSLLHPSPSPSPSPRNSPIKSPPLCKFLQTLTQKRIPIKSPQMPSLHRSSDRSTNEDHNHHHHHPNQQQQHRTMSKPSPKILSLILRAIIMSLLTSLFFLFLGLAAIFLLHLLLAGRHLHRHRHRRRQLQSQSSPLSSSEGISLDDLQSLPEFICSKSETECVICLDRIKNGDLFRVLPGCTHSFHLYCIDTWLVKTPACPICRARVCSPGSGAGPEQGKQQQHHHQLWDVRA